MPDIKIGIPALLAVLCIISLAVNMSEDENKETVNNRSKEQLINDGYKPCGTCLK